MLTHELECNVATRPLRTVWLWPAGAQAGSAHRNKAPSSSKWKRLFYFAWPVQSRGENQENIKHSSPCWLHTGRVLLSRLCGSARCPTYCRWANVGCHSISRKYGRGAAALVMKCTQSQTHIGNKTRTGAEQLWPCSRAGVASIIVPFRAGGSARRVLTKALFFHEPSLSSVHGENTYGLGCELISYQEWWLGWCGLIGCVE